MLLPVTLIRLDSFWSEDYSGACQYSTHASSFKGILSQSIIFAIRSLSCWDKEPITSKKAMIANVKTCENMWKPYLFVSSIFPISIDDSPCYSNHQKTHEISGKKTVCDWAWHRYRRCAVRLILTLVQFDLIGEASTCFDMPGLDMVMLPRS